MLLEILIIIIIAGIILVAGTVWFARYTVRTAIRESKPNLTININQHKKESILEELPELLQTLLALPSLKEIKKIERKPKLKKSNDNSEKEET